MISKIWRKFSLFYYWIRTHIWNRYHMLNMKSKQNGYSWGWQDRSELILFACMNLFKDFIEKERGGRSKLRTEMRPFDIAWGMNEQDFTEYFTGDIKKEQVLAELYDWWVGGRAAEHEAFDRMPTGLNNDIPIKTLDESQWEKWLAESDRIDNKDNEMLIKLIGIREYLWT